MLQPYMPALVQRVLDQINGPWEWTNLGADFERDSRCVQGALPTGHLMGTPAALIRKIDDAEVAALQARCATPCVQLEEAWPGELCYKIV